jgi:hypothetical protein
LKGEKRRMKFKIITGIMLTLLTINIVAILGTKALCTPVIAQSNPTATVYFDPPTINGTVVGQEFTVNLMIRDSPNITGWQAGLIFNSTLLNCTGFFEGEFLKDVGGEGYTFWVAGSINNTVGNGTVTAYGCILLVDVKASGNGRLAYLTFTVKTPGISDLHLRDVLLGDWIEVKPGQWQSIIIPSNIIDVYTVVLDTTPRTVVTVSNSTGLELLYHSGFYGHAFTPGYGISFNVTGPYCGFSNVTIPETLMSGAPSGWAVIIDSTPLSTENITVTYNGTHYSIYFTYSEGIHTVQIASPYVAPEFPSAIILPLFMLFTFIAVEITKKNDIRKTRKLPEPA